jgi:hypothetical protein
MKPELHLRFFGYNIITYFEFYTYIYIYRKMRWYPGYMYSYVQYITSMS